MNPENSVNGGKGGVGCGGLFIQSAKDIKTYRKHYLPLFLIFK
jgi:hypothetical protein